MSDAFGVPLLIANPRHGRGNATVLARLIGALRARGVDADVVTTERPGHAVEIARQAVEDAGRTYLVAVGGDGTVHEVLNGVVDAATGEVRGEDPVVGAVGAGTGCDLLRTFGLDRSPEVLADHLVTEHTLRIDVGRVTLTGVDGRRTSRVFANLAEVGYGGQVVALANRLPRWIGRARYGIAIVGAVSRFRHVACDVTVDQGSVHQRLSNVLVANGQFFAGGLKVAPRALPTDGRFNVQVWGARPIDVVTATRQLRSGDHLARPDVREWQSATVEVSAERPLIVEGDGEVLGTTPASFDVLEGALRFKL